MAHRWIPMLLALLLAAGCTTRSETFPGYEPDAVWRAMVSAAELPDYSSDDPARRWSVRENNVRADPATRRIEMERWLVRDRSGPGIVPRREERRYRMRLQLDEGEEAPTVVVKSLESEVPAHVWEEAERYFADVRSSLSGAAARD